MAWLALIRWPAIVAWLALIRWPAIVAWLALFLPAPITTRLARCDGLGELRRGRNG